MAKVERTVETTTSNDDRNRNRDDDPQHQHHHEQRRQVEREEQQNDDKSSAAAVGGGGILYLMLIAHPDDESMFFLPTLLTLLQPPSSPTTKNQNQNQNRFHLLCLSSGNYDGLGPQRTQELRNAAALLSDRIEVSVLDDPKLQDGPWPWDENYIALDVVARSVVHTLGLTMGGGGGGGRHRRGSREVVVLTFDKGGVSGHINHVYTHLGAVRFHALLQQKRRQLRRRQQRCGSETRVRDGSITTGSSSDNHLRTIAESGTEVKVLLLRTISNPVTKYVLTIGVVLFYMVASCV